MRKTIVQQRQSLLLNVDKKMFKILSDSVLHIIVERLYKNKNDV